MAGHVQSVCPSVEYNPLGRTLTLKRGETAWREGTIAIVTAGTSDLPVAEEARVTCEMLGSRAFVVSDVGVAGIHRLLDRLAEIRQARVIIVAAGMEGALASVVGGLELVSKVLQFNYICSSFLKTGYCNDKLKNY